MQGFLSFLHSPLNNSSIDSCFAVDSKFNNYGTFCRKPDFNKAPDLDLHLRQRDNTMYFHQTSSQISLICLRQIDNEMKPHTIKNTQVHKVLPCYKYNVSIIMYYMFCNKIKSVKTTVYVQCVVYQEVAFSDKDFFRAMREARQK